MTDQEKLADLQEKYDQLQANYMSVVLVNADLGSKMVTLLTKAKKALDHLGTLEDVQVAYRAGRIDYTTSNRLVGAQSELINALKEIEQHSHNQTAQP